MNPSYLVNAGQYLIDVLFDFYIILVMLRFMLQWAHADFYNPISQFIVTLTNPPLIFLRRFIPGLFGVDFAALVLLVALAMLKLLLSVVLTGALPNLLGVLVLAVATIVKYSFYMMMFAVLARIILSWVAPYNRHPAAMLINQISEPLMAPVRRILPPMGGLDLSPMLLFVFINLGLMLIVQPLYDLGVSLL